MNTLTLAEARERATEARKLRLDGIDPIEAKRARLAALRAADARAMTFRQCVDGYFKDHADAWRNHRYRSDWLASLQQYALPLLGSLPVGAIDTPLVLRVLKPIWGTIPETASRVRGRIERVLDWAVAHHYRNFGDNPARWGGRLEHALPARRKVAPVEHHASLPYVEIAGVMANLRSDASVTAAALQFIILTAARLNEVLGATWDEVDVINRTWIVPAHRMKGNRAQKVPLSELALAVLKTMQATRRNDWLFPGSREGRPVGHNSLWRLIKRASGNDEVTIHGLRSTFRDWAAERTNFPREVAEAALAHAVPDAVEAAYKRTDFFERRRKLMDAWADYCARPNAAGKVVALLGRGAKAQKGYGVRP